MAGHRGPIVLTPPLVSPVPQPRANLRGPMRAPTPHYPVRPVQLRPQQPHIPRTQLPRPYIPPVRPRPQPVYSTNAFPPRYPMPTNYRPFMTASPNMTYSLRPSTTNDNQSTRCTLSASSTILDASNEAKPRSSKAKTRTGKCPKYISKLFSFLVSLVVIDLFRYSAGGF